MVLKGNIVFNKSVSEFEVVENGYLVYNDGVVVGVYKELPAEYANDTIEDYGDKIIIPGLVDTHIHAPQYTFRGLKMDLELLPWLNSYTFPEESKYTDLEYAKKAYGIFVNNLKKSATTRAIVFATMHRPATIQLMDMLEEAGLATMVGKVNMNRNSPDYLCETTEESLSETRKWIEETLAKGYKNTQPILTPRFTPTCTDELMAGLAELKKEFDLPVQSHLSENPGEIAWVAELCPWSKNYGDAYDHFGMFDNKTVMAHCVHSPEEEVDVMAKNGVFVSHCPESNINLTSGVAPIRKYLERGVNVGLGSDVAAGSTENMFAAMHYAIQASKMRCRMLADEKATLTAAEAFYLATEGGGAFFGKVGSFKPGYEMDAVVLDDSRLTHPAPETLSPEDRLERMIYFSDDREIAAKYVKGVKMYAGE